jgi:hypothetical protein
LYFEKNILKEEDDSYLNQEWANSSGLANSLQGLNNISWKP